MATYRNTSRPRPAARKVSLTGQRRFIPQIGLNVGRDIRVANGQFGIADAGGNNVGALVTDQGNPIILG